MLCQPLLPPLVVRHSTLQASPELRRVVWGVQVDQVVDNRLLGDRPRQQHGLPVEVQPPAAAA